MLSEEEELRIKVFWGSGTCLLVVLLPFRVSLPSGAAIMGLWRFWTEVVPGPRAAAVCSELRSAGTHALALAGTHVGTRAAPDPHACTAFRPLRRSLSFATALLSFA